MNTVINRNRARTGRVFAGVMSGILLLAACGGSGESRTRNAAFDFIDLPADCYPTQEAKDAAIFTINEGIRRGEQGFRDIPELSAESIEIKRQAADIFTQAQQYVVSDPEYSALMLEFEQLNERALEVDARYKEAEYANSLIGLLVADRTTAENTPICGSIEAQAEPEPTPSDSSIATESTDVVTTDVVPTDDGSTTETTTPQSETDTPTETTSPTDQGTAIAASVPCTAVPDQGTELVVAVGEAVDLSFVLCENANKIRLRGPKSRGQMTATARYAPNKFKIVGKSVGTTRINARQIDTSTKPAAVLSRATRIKVTVVDPQSDDPCNGKKPEMAWYGDDRLEGIATCEPIDHIRVSVVKVGDDQSRTEVFNGKLTSGVPLANAVSYFGLGEYTVAMAHVRIVDGVEQVVGEFEYMTVFIRAGASAESTDQPDTTDATESTDAAESTDATESTDDSPSNSISNNGVISERLPEGVETMPVFALAPVATAAPSADPSEGPQGPVVAVASDTSTLVCDESCLASIIERAGVDSGTVEIAVGDAPWAKVTSTKAVALPPGATSVKVRLTPDSGDAQEFEMAVVRESVDAAFANVTVDEDDEVDIADETVAVASSSGFPVWAIVLIAVLVLAAGGVVTRRRLQARTAGD